MKKSLIIVGLIASLMFTGNVLAKDEILSISYAYGDVDMNGAINMKDGYITLKRAVGNIELNSNQLILADIDHSGNINSSDSLKILNFNDNITENLEYININPLKEEWSLAYKIGDVNLDKKINADDLNEIKNIIDSEFNDKDKSVVSISSNERLNNSRTLKLADANQDGIISLVDYKLLESGSVDVEITFTDSNIIATTDVYLAGDANLDGNKNADDANIIEQHYIDKELTPFELAICDVNGDELCNNTDLNLIKSGTYEAKNVIVLTENNPTQKKEYLYGDLDLDGYITFKDKELLNSYIDDNKNFNGIIKENLLADVDKNGIVDTNDITRIENIITHVSGTTINKTNAIYAGKVTLNQSNPEPKPNEETKPNEEAKPSEEEKPSNPPTPTPEPEVEETENPKTGVAIPLISLGVFGVVAILIFIVYKKKKYFFKI